MWLTPRNRASVRVVHRDPAGGGTKRVAWRIRSEIAVVDGFSCRDRGASLKPFSRRPRLNRWRQNDTVDGSSSRARAISRFDRPRAASRRIRARRRTRGGVSRSVIHWRKRANSSGERVIRVARRTFAGIGVDLKGPRSAVEVSSPRGPFRAVGKPSGSGHAHVERGEAIDAPTVAVGRERGTKTLVANRSKAARTWAAHPKVYDHLGARGAYRLRDSGGRGSPRAGRPGSH